MGLFPPLSPDARRVLDGLPSLIDRVFPLPRRFRRLLGRDVAELSRLLTADRKERGESYLGKPDLLSAYLRYFLPWNLYRLCRLLPALPLTLAGGDAVNDLGSGPLTLALALWICRPDLRPLALEFRCLDRTGTVLEAGKSSLPPYAPGREPLGRQNHQGRNPPQRRPFPCPPGETCGPQRGAQCLQRDPLEFFPRRQGEPCPVCGRKRAAPCFPHRGKGRDPGCGAGNSPVR